MITGGVVLAGGQSSRMGQPKALLDWHGTPLVVHVARMLSAATAGGPVVVVSAPGQDLPPLPEGVLLARDRVEGRGPLQGLAAGLSALGDSADAAIVLGTDQPFAGRDLVARLTAALQESDDAVAIRLDGHVQPLGALYRTRVTGAAQTRLASGQASLRGLLADVRTREISGSAADAAALRSLDTPEAYAAALAETPTA